MDHAHAAATAQQPWGIPASQERKYTTDPSTGRLINRHTGKEVDGPLFILRASDVHAVETLKFYMNQCRNPDQRAAVKGGALRDFIEFDQMNPLRMKEPDPPLRMLAATDLAPPTCTPVAPAAGLQLDSDQPLEHKGEPVGNGDACDVCQ